MNENYLIFKIIKTRNLLQGKRLNINKLVTLQSCLDLIECSVSIEPNARTENSPSPSMTTKTSQAMIANGLAQELSFPLSLTHFLTQSCHLYLPTVRCGPGLSAGTKQDDQLPPPPPPPNFVFQLPCLPVIPIHKVLN